MSVVSEPKADIAPTTVHHDATTPCELRLVTAEDHSGWYPESVQLFLLPVGPDGGCFPAEASDQEGVRVQIVLTMTTLPTMRLHALHHYHAYVLCLSALQDPDLKHTSVSIQMPISRLSTFRNHTRMSLGPWMTTWVLSPGTDPTSQLFEAYS